MKEERVAHCFESRDDGSLVIWSELEDEDSQSVIVEAHRVRAVLLACADALARVESRR